MNETTRTFFFPSSGSGRGGRSLFFRSLSLDELHPHTQAKPRPRQGYVRFFDQPSPSNSRRRPSPSSSSSSDRYYSLTSSAASPASSANSSTTSCRDWVDGRRPGIQNALAAGGGGDDVVRMCRLTADELVATETVYVTDLRSVIEGYLIPVRARASSSGLMQVEVQNLFGNVEQLYTFHESFRRKLEENRENFAELARCFSESKADLRRHYEYYVQNYPKALATLYDGSGFGERFGGGSHSTQLEALRCYVRSRQLHLQHSLPLSSYLLKPVQRILKYPLILKNLERHVIEAGISRDVLSAVRTALADLSGVAARINESRKVAENDEKLRTLVRGLLNWPGRGRDARGILKDLLRFGDLILEDELDCWVTPTSGSSHIPYPLKTRCDRKRAAKTRHVFLFQSAILIFKKVDAMTYTFKDMLPCRDVKICDTLVSNAVPKWADANCCFALLKSTSRCGSVGQHFLKCSNPSQKSLWITSIRDLTNAYHHHTTPPIQTRYEGHATRFYLDSKIEPSDKRLSLDSEQLASSRQGVIGAVDLASKALSSFQRLTTIRRSSTSITKMASHFYDSTSPSCEVEEQLCPLNPEQSGLDLTPLNPYLLPPHAINFEEPPPGTITSLPSRWSQTSSGSSTYSSSSSGVHSGTSCTNMSGCREIEK